ncbi:division/cell wall cluster transcriptional repressor MraZ [Candidatus Falkowbacteria bacterium]|nr:division/cell wall cluster transcriptional repressor MraZ [Candidatus Falkowbacteria bacterium]
MFIGEYNFSVDAKARIAIPAKFRVTLGHEFVITIGLDNCLSVYTKTEWTKLAEKLSSLPLGQANSRAFSRQMLGGAMDVRLDSQGRVILPDYLRKYAGINKKAVIVGLYNRLEIWDEAKWNSYKQRTAKQTNEIAEKLGELGV